MVKPNPDTETPRLSRKTLVRLYVLTLGALSVSVYLSYVSLVTGQSPAGCGSGSGCAQVLASKWSRCLGLPVSLIASAMYISVFFAVGLTRSRSIALKRLAWFFLTAASVSILIASGWFTYLQIVTLGAICPYCMAGHALGSALALLILWQATRCSLASAGLGLAPVVAMILIQLNTAAVVGTIDNQPHSNDADTATDAGRTITLLSAKLTLTLQNEPLLGSADAPNILVVMLDYACPHCRHTHNLLQQIRDDHPDQLAIIALLTPMNHGCNPHAPLQMPKRFDESCELARIALAVFLADPSAFEPFDRWMFEPQTPRTATQARDEAISRVGTELFEQSYSDTRTRQMIERNVYAYGQSGADRVPVLISPGARTIYGRVDDPHQIIDMLGLEPAGGSQ